MTRPFVGLQNFEELFGSGAFVLGLKSSGLFMALCVPLNLALPLCLAMLLQKAPRLSRVFSMIFLLPPVIPTHRVSGPAESAAVVSAELLPDDLVLAV